MDAKTTRVRTNGEKARSESESTKELRQGIEQTRAEISETLVAIEARVNPTTVKQTVTEGFEAAKQAVQQQLHEATVGKVENMAHKAERAIDDVRGSVVDTIRENPVPAILTGVGLAWLFMNRRSRSTSRQLPQMRGYVLQGGGYEEVGQAAGQIAEKVQTTAQDVSQRVQEKAHEVSERAKETSGRVAERAGEVAAQTRVQARRLENRIEQSFFENPIGFAALSIAAGAALGLALPRTRREDELMGGSRERLLEKAQSSVQGAVQKAEQVAKTIVTEPRRVMESQEPRAEQTAGESVR